MPILTKKQSLPASDVPLKHSSKVLSNHERELAKTAKKEVKPLKKQSQDSQVPIPIDGISAKELFGSDTGVTYRDYLALPGYIDFHPSDVNLESKLSRDIHLNHPFISSPMDTVTESKMAIALALLGGLGIIHYNNQLKEQVRLVEQVKRYENAFIRDPIVLSPEHKISDIDAIKERYGFSGIPITEDGTRNSRLLGIVTNRDIDLESDRLLPIYKVMSTDIVSAKEGIELSEANKILKKSKKGKLPILNTEGKLSALLCRSDLQKNQNFPFALKDEHKRLRVGAAISTQKEAYERVPELIRVGVDCLVIDSAQGHSSFELDIIRWLKKNYPQVQVIAGNVVTVEQSQALIQAGCDALRVGMGPGSICITQDMVAVGRAQATAVYHTARFASRYGVPVIADGGAASIGDIANALAIVASSVMMGSMFAGTQEAPGDYFYENGIRLKQYRGMASLEAYKSGGAKRYFVSQNDIKVPQGVSGAVVDKGSMMHYVPYLLQGLRLSFQDMGVRSIPELHEKMYAGKLRFEKRSLKAQEQGSPHGLHSYAPPSFPTRTRG